MSAPTFTVVALDLFERGVVLRLPFRFGVVTLTACPQAFARAAKVSRAGVNKWLAKPPPTLNAYVKTAIGNELAEITTRYDKIADIEVAVRARDELMQLAAIRVLKRLQMQGKKS